MRQLNVFLNKLDLIQLWSCPQHCTLERTEMEMPKKPRPMGNSKEEGHRESHLSQGLCRHNQHPQDAYKHQPFRCFPEDGNFKNSSQCTVRGVANQYCFVESNWPVCSKIPHQCRPFRWVIPLWEATTLRRYQMCIKSTRKKKSIRSSGDGVHINMNGLLLNNMLIGRVLCSPGWTWTATPTW